LSKPHDPTLQPKLRQRAYKANAEKNCFKKFTDPLKINKKRKHTSRHRQTKEHQAVTGGIFYCRDSAGFSGSASDKLSCNLTGNCLAVGYYSYTHR